jgi:hypothetical protein
MAFKEEISILFGSDRRSIGREREREKTEKEREREREREGEEEYVV